MENIIKVESVVPDQPVRTAHANLGRHFTHMHQTLFHRARPKYKNILLSENTYNLCWHLQNTCQLLQNSKIQQIRQSYMQLTFSGKTGLNACVLMAVIDKNVQSGQDNQGRHFTDRLDFRVRTEQTYLRCGSIKHEFLKVYLNNAQLLSTLCKIEYGVGHKMHIVNTILH